MQGLSVLGPVADDKSRHLVEPFPFRLNRNGALVSCFDAFSSREPVSTSLENAPDQKVFCEQPFACGLFARRALVHFTSGSASFVPGSTMVL